MTVHDVSPASLRPSATHGSETQARFLPDPAWLVRGNPEHPEHDVLGLRNPRGIQVPELAVIGGAQVYGDGLAHGQSRPAMLGELRAACAMLGLRCFDLSNYLRAFVGDRIFVQDSRQGLLSAKGCELLARFVRERVLPGAEAPGRMAHGTARPHRDAAVGQSPLTY